MEYRGISIDTRHLAATSESVGSQLLQLRETIHSAAGESFNIDSPKQLSHILFEVLGLPTKKPPKPASQPMLRSLKNSPLSTPLSETCLNTGACRKSRPHTSTRCPKYSTPKQGGYTHPSTSTSPPPAGSPLQIRTCRTFPSAPRSAGKSAKPSSQPTPGTCCSRPTTPRLSFA